MEQPLLYHKKYGEGHPVVILHGLFGMSDNWVTFTKRLAEDYMVILIDMRNHGRSPHTQEMNYIEMAEDIARTMESEWVHHAHIIGHSMGGKAAMQLAEIHPDMVDRLIVLDIGPGEYPGGHNAIFEAMCDLDIEKLSSRKEAEKILLESIPNKGLVLFMLKNLSRKKSGGYEWKFNLPLLREKYDNIKGRVDLHNIDIPSLFIGGKDSGYMNESQLKLIDQHFDHYQIEMLDNAGHWLHVDQPDALFDLIYDFLK